MKPFFFSVLLVCVGCVGTFEKHLSESTVAVTKPQKPLLSMPLNTNIQMSQPVLRMLRAVAIQADDLYWLGATPGWCKAGPSIRLNYPFEEFARTASVAERLAEYVAVDGRLNLKYLNRTVVYLHHFSLERNGCPGANAFKSYMGGDLLRYLYPGKDQVIESRARRWR